MHVESINDKATGSAVTIIADTAYKGLTGRIKRTLDNGLVQIQLDPQQQYFRDSTLFTTSGTSFGYFRENEIEVSE